MAFEHHPGLHALWLASEGKSQENDVRTTEPTAQDDTPDDAPKVRRKKSARVFGQDFW